MSKTFDAYAAYYDLLYAAKDYAGEATWIDALIRRHRPDAHHVLELGCGTGGHALHLARHGYAICGIDLSERMVEKASANAMGAGLGSFSPNFSVGDLRTFRHSGTFDVVISLFHVMSYQITNADLQAAIATAKAHLSPGGIFIFDCWYGPGVLSDPPVTRVRRLESGGVSVIRIAEPEHKPNENRVDVNFQILVGRGDVTHQIRECHAMRYLFTPEVELLLSGGGLRLLSATKWLDASPLDKGDWNACYVAEK